MSMLYLLCICAHRNISFSEKRKKRDTDVSKSDGAQPDTSSGGETSGDTTSGGETSGASETAGGAAETSGVTGNTTACIPTSSAPDALLVSLDVFHFFLFVKGPWILFPFSCSFVVKLRNLYFSREGYGWVPHRICPFFSHALTSLSSVENSQYLHIM